MPDAYPRPEPEPDICRCGHDESDHYALAYETGCNLCGDCGGFTDVREPDPDEEYEAYRDRWLDDHLDYLGVAS